MVPHRTCGTLVLLHWPYDCEISTLGVVCVIFLTLGFRLIQREFLSGNLVLDYASTWGALLSMQGTWHLYWIPKPGLSHLNFTWSLTMTSQPFLICKKAQFHKAGRDWCNRFTGEIYWGILWSHQNLVWTNFRCISGWNSTFHHYCFQGRSNWANSEFQRGRSRSTSHHFSFWGRCRSSN